MKLERVNYEVSFRPSTAASARFTNALFTCEAEVRATSKLFPEMWLCVVAVAPLRAAEFRTIAGVRKEEMLYRSPTWFDNGTIRPHFASPEAELEAREREQAMKRVAPYTEGFYEVHVGYDTLPGSVYPPAVEIHAHAIGYEKGRPFVATNYQRLPVFGSHLKEGLVMGMCMLAGKLSRVFQERMDEKWKR